MWPGEAFEVQKDRLGVLNLCEMNRNLTRRIQFNRRLDGELSRALPRNAWLGADQVRLLAEFEGRNNNHLFNGFNPENRRHLHGVGVRRGGAGLALQEGDVVGSAAERHGRRRRVNDDGRGLGDLLFADVIAQQFVGIVQHGLGDGSGGDEAA